MRRVARRPLVRAGDPLIPVLSLVCLMIPLLILGAVFVKYRALDVGAPRVAPPPDDPVPREAALDLTVIITDQGFHMKVDPRFVKPWMSAAVGGAGPDIPRTDQGFDFVRLGERLREIKREHRRETRIILGAEDHIPYEVLIRTMDFARGDETEQLFPQVTLTRGVV